MCLIQARAVVVVVEGGIWTTTRDEGSFFCNGPCAVSTGRSQDEGNKPGAWLEGSQGGELK